MNTITPPLSVYHYPGHVQMFKQVVRWDSNQSLLRTSNDTLIVEGNASKYALSVESSLVKSFPQAITTMDRADCQMHSGCYRIS